MITPKEIGARQRRVCEALEDAGGELSLSDLRRALPDVLRQHVYAAIAALEGRGAVEIRYEDGEKHIAYVFPERSLQTLSEDW